MRNRSEKAPNGPYKMHSTCVEAVWANPKQIMKFVRITFVNYQIQILINLPAKFICNFFFKFYFLGITVLLKTGHIHRTSGSTAEGVHPGAAGLRLWTLRDSNSRPPRTLKPFLSPIFPEKISFSRAFKTVKVLKISKLCFEFFSFERKGLCKRGALPTELRAHFTTGS